MRTAIKKLLVISIACVLGMGVMFGLTACGGGGDEGPSDEELITADIDEMMTALKDPTSEEAKELLGDLDDEDMAVFEEYGIDPYEFIGQCFSRVEYSVDAVNVEGESATVDMTIKNVDLNAAMEAAGADFETFTETDEAMTLYSSDGMQGLMGKFMEFFYAQIAASETVVETPTTLNYTMVDGEWTISDEGAEEFASAMYGGLDMSSL